MGYADSYTQGFNAGRTQATPPPDPLAMGLSGLAGGLGAVIGQQAIRELYAEQLKEQKIADMRTRGILPLKEAEKLTGMLPERLPSFSPPGMKEQFVDLSALDQAMKMKAMQTAEALKRTQMEDLMRERQIGQRQVSFGPNGPMIEGPPVTTTLPPPGSTVSLPVAPPTRRLPTIEELRQIPAGYSHQPKPPRLPFKTTAEGKIELQPGASLTATEAETARRLDKEMRESAGRVNFRFDQGALVWEFPPSMDSNTARLMAKIVSDQAAMSEADKVLFHQAVKDASDIGLSSVQRQNAAALRDQLIKRYQSTVPIRLEQKKVDLPPVQGGTLEDFLREVKKKAAGPTGP